MLSRVIRVIGQLGHWGYLVIFVFVTLESALFLGFVVPGETVVLFGGFLANQGVFDLGDLVVLVTLAAILGDSIGFVLGRHLGREWLLRHAGWGRLKPEQLARFDAFFAHHGGKAVFLGRFSAFFRAMVPFMAGASGMRYAPFFLYNVVGGVVWSVAMVLAGYFVGASWTVLAAWIGRASALLAGAIVLLIVVIWVARWLVRHEGDLKRSWSAFLAAPRVAALRRRFRPAIAFLQERMTPGGYLGLHLTIGAAAVVAFTWLFGGVVQDVLAGDPLTVVGSKLEVWLQAHATPSVTLIMTSITRLAAPPVIAAVTLVGAILLVWRRSWYRLLALALAVPGGLLLGGLTRLVFEYLVVDLAIAREQVVVSRFPSMHTLAAVLVYGVLAVFAIRTARSWRWRVYIALGTLVLIMVVGFSRLYLNVQYLSDVVGAAAEGLTWLAFCLTGVETLRLRRAASSGR